MTNDKNGGGDPNLSLALLWGTQERPSRGPKPSLTVHGIARAGIELADEKGVTGLSMRQVATKLGVGTMSLYRYVPSKAELIDVMLDMVYGESMELVTTPPGDWREGMAEIARNTLAVYQRHTWLVDVPTARPLMGPNAVAGFEHSLAVLAETGLRDAEKINVIMSVDSYVVGVARAFIDRDQAAQRTGVSDEQFWTAQAAVLSRIMSSGKYPHMAGLEAGVFEEVGETAFEFGLQRLLDGVAALIRDRVRT